MSCNPATPSQCPSKNLCEDTAVGSGMMGVGTWNYSCVDCSSVGTKPTLQPETGSWYMHAGGRMFPGDQMSIPPTNSNGDVCEASGATLAAQAIDGNIVMYGYNDTTTSPTKWGLGCPRWALSTLTPPVQVQPGNILQLTSKGILEIVSQDNKILWQASKNEEVVKAGPSAQLVFTFTDGNLVLFTINEEGAAVTLWELSENGMVPNGTCIGTGATCKEPPVGPGGLVFHNINVSTTLNKTIFYCKEKGPWIDIYAIDNITNKIYKNANMWLYMLYQSKDQQQQLADYETTYNDIIHNMNINLEYVNCNVIQFMSTFSKGTVHGYAALIYTLTEYINNDYGDYKILVYKDSQKGMIEIINHFVKLNFIDKNNIIYVESCIAYLFNVIKFIPVPLEWHSFPRDEHHKQVTRPRGGAGIDIISKYMIEQIEIESYDICIVKHNKSEKLTFRGEEETDYNILVNYCKKNNLFLLEPGTLNEILLVNYLYRCKKFVTSWGTSFFKNMGYLSSSCKKIIVIINEEGYFGEYTDEKNSGYLMKEYNGIPIEYYRADKYINLQRLE